MGAEELKAVTTVIAGLAVLSLAVGSLLGIAVAIKQLLAKPAQIDPSKEFVTRAELAKTVEEIDKKIGSMQMEISELKADMVKRMDKQSEYAHTIAHEQADIMHSMSLKVERLLTLREMDKKTPEQGS